MRALVPLAFATYLFSMSAHPRSKLFIPPAPEPRIVPKRSRPTLKGYAGYLRIMTTNPLEVWTQNHFHERILAGRLIGQHYVVVHDPQWIRHFLVTNAENYALTEIRRAMFEPVIGKGLLIAEGDLWKRTRRALTPVFTPRHVSGFAPMMARVATRTADAFAAKNQSPISATQSMLTLALDVLIACLFSDAEQGEERLDSARFSRNLDRLMSIAGMPHPLDLVGAPRWAPRLGRGEALRIVADIRRQVSSLLEARRRLIESGGESINDFLGLLINAGVDDGQPLSDDEIVDNLITFLSAGHETTARTLAWTLYLLSKDNEIYERAAAEVDTVGLSSIDPANWPGALPFVTSVIKESMRLYPAASILTRDAIGDDAFGQTPVPAGSNVITAPWVLHRHQMLWDEPDAFNPDRFMGAAGEQIERFAYIPFGAGPRVCIGASFSMQEMVIIIATFLARFRFKHVGAIEPNPVMRVTIQPSTPIDMVFTPR